MHQKKLAIAVRGAGVVPQTSLCWMCSPGCSSLPYMYCHVLKMIFKAAQLNIFTLTVALMKNGSLIAIKFL